MNSKNHKENKSLKIVYITSRVPFQLDKGDKLRAYHHIKYLSKRHKVYLFALNESFQERNNLNGLQDLCEKILIFRLSFIQILINLIKNSFKSLPFQTAYFFLKE